MLTLMLLLATTMAMIEEIPLPEDIQNCFDRSLLKGIIWSLVCVDLYMNMFYIVNLSIFSFYSSQPNENNLTYLSWYKKVARMSRRTAVLDDSVLVFNHYNTHVNV